MSVGGIILLSGFLTLLSDQLINFVAGPVLGASLLGIYGMSSELASLPLSKFMPVINQTMLPAFSKLQEHRESATYYLDKLLGVTSLAFIPMMVGMACVADTLVMTFFGAKWAASILPLVIMSVGMVFRMTTIQLKTVMTSMGRADLQLKSNALQLMLLLPLTIYSIKYGVIGLMIAWVTTELFVMFATIQLSKSVLDLSFARLLRCFRPALVSSAIMAASVLGIKSLMGNQDGMLVLSIEIGVGVISFYLATRLIFIRELQTAFKAAFGNRFAALVGHPGK
jgi:O-antigen/teichoic acid export membrane protein